LSSRVAVNLGERSYPIFIDSALLSSIGSSLKKIARGKKVAIVTNGKVFNLHGKGLFKSLKKSGFSVSLIKIPDGEKHKNLSTISSIYDQLVKANFDRSDSIIAFGGGVVGDMAGFASATYMRGIDYIQIPTTLLAQVDSSVGGKTGVDHSGGKNLIGSFYQPKMVLADLSTLETLSKREMRCGMAEVIKYGIIRKERVFSFLERSLADIKAGDVSTLEKIVKTSCMAKADVVAEDERESGVRAILNYGHTFAHGIETALGFKKLKHGEAVAIGMVHSARLSAILGFTDEKPLKRIVAILKGVGLPTLLPSSLSSSDVIEGMKHDKKVIAGKTRLILIDKIGNAFIQSGIKAKDIKKAII